MMLMFMHDNGNFEVFENFTNFLCILFCKKLLLQ